MFGNNHAKLPATIEDPVISFTWDGKAPPIEPSSWRNDQYKDLEDKEIVRLIIEEGLTLWSEVDGSYLRLKLAEVDESITEKLDSIHSITIAKVDENSSTLTAGYARPFPDPHNSSIIIDCDIVITGRKQTAKNLARVIFHELGHCVGLGHPHESFTSLMSYSSAGELSLKADDMAGVFFLYPESDDHSFSDIYGSACGSLGIYYKNHSPSQTNHLWLIILLSLPFIIRISSRHISA
ncbi:MAG: matrixin family metalloprotease [Proteobacteria bacterium]|nr:matrixin family metalloprotease [Pseudomonadota bacterium]